MNEFTIDNIKPIILKSLVSCPKCGFQKDETMPEDACQFFYECEKCKTVLKPKAGDCCVYCSFGSVKCPSIQENVNSNGNSESCNINDKGSSCCSPNVIDNNLKEHWDKAYLNSPEKKLGWYEIDLSPTLKLISKTGLNKSARILNVGSGSTTLIDELLKGGYINIIATYISQVALTNLEDRIESGKATFIIDDLTSPIKLKNIAPVDLWIDRAVLHFFTKENEQNIYFDLLKSKVKNNGFVLFAEYNLNGATQCAGLPVYRYNKEMLTEKLG